jgi:acyl dehydratase
MDIEKIRNLNLPPVEHRYGVRDTILYALGLGYGADPLDQAELRFVYEENLKVVPAICSVISHPGFWLKDPAYKIDWVKVLHAEQAFTIYQAIPVSGHIRGEFRIIGVEDKGIGKGAMLHLEKTLFDVASNQKLATVRSTVILRGDGGQGGYGEAMKAATPLPPGEPHRAMEIPTLAGAALIYRLSGDWNPLHADPKIARQAGFDRPILHGLCTYGVACRAILKTYCDNDPTRLRSLFARFSAPVYPGETIRVEFHESEGEIRFKAIAKERGVVVLDRCSAEVAPCTPVNRQDDEH